MSDLDLSKDPIRADGQPAARPARRSVKAFIIAALVAVLGLSGLVAARAIDGPGFGPGLWMRGPGHMFGPARPDPAAVEDRVDRGIRHLAIEIDATPEQQDKLRAIAKGLVKDLLPLRDARVEVATRARTLLAAATVDKAEVEKFRAEQVARMDATSKRITQAIDDISDVLTVEQRRKIADRLPNPGAMSGPGAGPFGIGR